MRIVAFTQLARTYLPTTGVGRFMNNILLGMASRPGIELSLLLSREYLQADGQVDARSPLRGLPVKTFPLGERKAERLWKLLGMPAIDKFVGEADWVFSPSETRLPIRKTPVAMTIHDMNQMEPSLGWNSPGQQRKSNLRWAPWIGPATRHARRIFTVSEYSKQRIVDLLGIEPEKIVVVGCGAEQSYFDIYEKDPATLPRPCAEPYVLVIGGLNQRKGGEHVLAVAGELARRKSPLRILIAGPNDQLKERVAEHPNVRLLGFVPDEDLPALLRGASSLLFLSYYEGFGIPAAEAMAAGVPAIVSNRTSLPEVVGEAGFVRELTDAEGISDLADNLLSDNVFRERHVLLGRERAEQYQWSACVDRLLAGLNCAV